MNKVKSFLLKPIPRWVMFILTILIVFVPMFFGLMLAFKWGETMGFVGTILGVLIPSTTYTLMLAWLLWRRQNGIIE